MKNKVFFLWQLVKYVKNWYVYPLNRFRAVHYKIRGGGTIYVRPPDLCAFNDVFIFRHYEADLPWRSFHRIIDIGANIGAFTVFAAMKMNPAGEILSLEPEHENYKMLHANIRENFLRALALQSAVGEEECTRSLYLSSPGEHTLYGDPKSFHVPVRHVHCTTLANLLGEGTCDLLKMDCEGAEYEIIRSLPVDCFNRISNIIMEYHHFVPGETPDALKKYLEQQGYTVTSPRKSFFLARR